ncbi:putative transcriptional regulator, partial [Pseudomonas fluorescens BRIP34879]
RCIVNDPQRGYCFVAPLQTVDAPAIPRHNLAARLSPLIGHAELLGALGRRLCGQRLMTLTGCAGIGKSTLALALAERVLPRYRDGVWWVELATVASPQSMLRQVCSALQLSPCDTVAQLCRQLAVRQLLLVLDGADLLLGACRHLVRCLQQQAPQVTVLLSSREALRCTSVEQAMACPAVQLFVARVQAAQQGFVLRAQDLPALRDICRRLDGIPLAVELAAAQVHA